MWGEEGRWVGRQDIMDEEILLEGLQTWVVIRTLSLIIYGAQMFFVFLCFELIFSFEKWATGGINEVIFTTDLRRDLLPSEPCFRPPHGVVTSSPPSSSTLISRYTDSVSTQPTLPCLTEEILVFRICTLPYLSLTWLLGTFYLLWHQFLLHWSDFGPSKSKGRMSVCLHFSLSFSLSLVFSLSLYTNTQHTHTPKQASDSLLGTNLSK
jgi:hypothetical protein